MSEWIEWNGGECPVEPKTRVYTRCRGESELSVIGMNFAADFLDWDHDEDCPSGDIVAYRIVEDN